MRRTRAALVLLKEPLYLPRVVGPLLADPGIELVDAVLVPPRCARNVHPGASLGVRAIAARAPLCGTRAFIAAAARYVRSAVHRNVAGTSLAALTRARGVHPLRWRGSVNDARLVERIRASRADVVLGVFSERAGAALRTATPAGVVLLHYSVLPRFPGCEPTFWTLLEDPDAAGVTFFVADEALDGGAIASQARRSLTHVRSLHEAIATLSDLAGEGAASALQRAVCRDVGQPRCPPENLRGWPSADDVRRFRERGYSFA